MPQVPMNSYIRQTIVPAEQMHGFLKDKQAWENAIAMYQGPDPLDHWYNYICWYENHRHGDPENKFREVLERCLTQYEHSDYYKQDPRMVRLWVKYIDMQTNPLHFYQVLYQRGVGRQIAAFYISWAGVYESVNAFKEAESVYNLGFQEKAQSYAELYNAHNKLAYLRLSNAPVVTVQELKVSADLPAQVLALPEPEVRSSQQQPSQQLPPPQLPPQQLPPQQLPPQQLPPQQLPPQQLPPHQLQPQGVQYQTHYIQQHTHVVQQRPMTVTIQQPQQQNYRLQTQQQPQSAHPIQVTMQHQQVQYQTQHSSYHIQNHTQQHIQAQPQTHQHIQAQPQTHQHIQTQPHIQQHIQTQPQTQQHIQAQPQTQQQLQHNHIVLSQNQTQTHQQASNNGVRTQQQTHVIHKIGGVTYLQKTVQPAAVVPIEPQRPAAEKQPAVIVVEDYVPQRQIPQQQLPQQQTQPQVVDVPAPSRVEQTISNVEGIKWPHMLHSFARNNFETWKPALCLEEPADPSRECHYAKKLVYPGTGTEYSPEEIRARKHQRRLEELKHQRQMESVSYNVELHHLDNVQQVFIEDEPTHYVSSPSSTSLNRTHESVELYDDNEAGAEDDEDVYEENGDAEENGEEEHIYEPEAVDHPVERFTMHTLPPETPKKTIKIKFRKEPKSGVDAVNGSNYSAYTIESIYQQEVASPVSAQDQASRRNGYSFHPYMLGQTSTPKTTAKRSKTKIKRVNKFQVVHCGSSNSSSADNVPISAHATARENSLYATDNALQQSAYNDNANFSFSSAAGQDNSNCSVTAAVGRLNFRETSAVANNGAVADFSTYQENSYFATQHDIEAKERRLEKALQTIERHMTKEAVDPFSSELCRAFLTKLDFPGSEDGHANYKIIQTPLPKIANTRSLPLPDGLHFLIDKEVGRGSYGSVYKATDAKSGAVVALKYQKPPNTWEIYICDQVLKRIQSPEVLPGLMDISTAIIAPNASLIATEFSPFGSLLDINNKIRQATTKVMHESLVMHFSAQICNIIHHLHMQKIIHADIKPDNFLLMRIPSTDIDYPSLRLIDFGCAIDMTLFPEPETTKFRKVIQTDGFTCIEMQEGRPWSYETDLFCIAGTVHVMLLGEYMQLQKRAGAWDIKQKLPRYLKKHVWTKFFYEMLNIKGPKLPDLSDLRYTFDKEAAKMDSELQSQIRTLSNILYRR